MLLNTCLVLFLTYQVRAFSLHSPIAASITATSTSSCNQQSLSSMTVTSRPSRRRAVLYSSPEGNDSGDTVKVAERVEEEDDGDSGVPIDLPSPILLSSSMVLAIASTGSLFEITGGKGSLPSLAIVIIGIPTCLFLFYAAIQKGIAETEADDAEFQRKTNRF